MGKFALAVVFDEKIERFDVIARTPQEAEVMGKTEFKRRNPHTPGRPCVFSCEPVYSNGKSEMMRERIKTQMKGVEQ